MKKCAIKIHPKSSKFSHQLLHSWLNLCYKKSIEMFLITKQYKLVFEIDWLSSFALKCENLLAISHSTTDIITSPHLILCFISEWEIISLFWIRFISFVENEKYFLYYWGEKWRKKKVSRVRILFGLQSEMVRHVYLQILKLIRKIFVLLFVWNFDEILMKFQL